MPGQLVGGIARVARLLPEELVVPEVLADRQPHPHAADLDHGHFRRGIEVAGLVEHVVRGQERLARHGGHLAVAQQRAGVEQPGALAGMRLGESHQRADAREDRIAREPLERRELPLDELAQGQQVLGRVAAQGQLGEDRQLGAGLGRLPRTPHDGRRVVLERAYRGVDLCQPDAHVPRKG